jgi:hypothetical protein
MDPGYKLHTEFTRAFVSAHADLKQKIAYRQAQQEWTKMKKKTIEKDIENCIQTDDDRPMVAQKTTNCAADLTTGLPIS